MRPKILAGLVAAGLLGSAARSYALPVFARRTGMPCTVCHAPVPRLTKFGYQFRAAGFRVPGDIGKTDEKPFSWTDFMSIRMIANVRSAKNPGARSSTGFQSGGLEIYPLTGSYLGHWGGETELDVDSGGSSLGAAYLKYVGGNADSFWTVRTGILRMVEGYGASDRPIGVTGLLFRQTKPVGSPFNLTLGAGNQAGLELGYSLKDTRITAAIANGISPSGAALQSGDDNNRQDFQLFVNQMIGNIGGVNAYYYNGRAGGTTATPATDRFSRWAVFANVPVLPLPAGSLEVLGGLGQGRDGFATSVTRATGFFGELRAPVTQSGLWASLRYDQADPAQGVSHDSVSGASLDLNYLAEPNILLQGGLQHQWNQRGAVAGSNQGNLVAGRVSFNF